MESGPPLNLSTSVKVQDVDIKKEAVLEVHSELVNRNDGVHSSYLVLQPDENETLTITGEVIADDPNTIKNETLQDEKNNLELPITNSINKVRHYKCSKCSETFQRATQLRIHEKSHLDEKEHQCEQCSEVFSRLSLLIQHKQEHTKKSYSCSECDISLATYSSYRIHMKKHKSEKRYECQQCPMSFTQQSHLITHLRKHTGEKPYICPICNTRFKQVSHLTTHVRIHTNDRPYVCDICNASFSQTGSLKRHKRSHTGEKPFKCNQCNAVFVEKRNLNRHQLSHSGIRPFSCDLCLASFTQMIDLKRHKLSHSGIKPYKCDICKAAFSRKNNLKWHKLTHEGNTPHICNVCNVGFRIARDLKSHKRTHIENKPYSCEECNAAFAQTTTLKRHSLVHSGKKPFSCVKCSATFFEKSALKRHLQRHTNNKPYPCEYCLTSFLEARALKRHKIVVHKEGKYEEDTEEIDVPTSNIKSDPLKVTNISEEMSNVQQPFETSYLKNNKLESTSGPEIGSQIIGPASDVSQIYFSQPDHEGSSQGPTLIFTQPGQPPKEGKPANNCQNHSSHVHTLFEGSSNQWQTWCFCDKPNIPSQTDILGCKTLNSGTDSEVPQSQEIDFSTNMTASEASQHQESLPLQASGEQVSQDAKNSDSLLNSLNQNVMKCDTVSHFQNDANSERVTVFDGVQTEFHSKTNYEHYDDQIAYSNNDPLITPGAIYSDPISIENTQIHHSSQQPYEENEKNMPYNERIPSNPSYQFVEDKSKKSFICEKEPPKIVSNNSVTNRIDNNLLPTIANMNSINHSVESGRNIKVVEEVVFNGVPTIVDSENYLTNDKVTYSTKDLGQNVIYSANQIENQTFMTKVPGEDQSEVTVQYTLTVNNPATGDIQIQSDAFPAKEAMSDSKHPIKKRKIVKLNASSNKEKKLPCQYCTKTFSKQGSLEMHIRIHTGEKPFICGICKQHFSHNNSLTIHMRSHTGERPYTCVYCNATFTQKSNLRVHHRTHTGEKPFKCDTCEASFSQGSHLKAHLRIHNNDRPFVCLTCGQAFTQKSALKRHQMKHTGIKPHACSECGTRFSQKDDLRRHLSSSHGQNQKYKQVTKKKTLTETKDSKVEKVSVEAAVKRNLVQNDAESSSSNTPSKIEEIHLHEVEVKSDKGQIISAIIESSSNPMDSDNSKMKLEKENCKAKSKDTEKLTMNRGKSKKMIIEPTRISRRIKEAAEKKKFKVKESDFITGDLDEIDEVEKLENDMVNSKLLQKENIKTETCGIVKSWCFCEVPHGPDEPHTKIDEKLSNSELQSYTKTNKNIGREGVLRLQQMANSVVVQESEGPVESNTTQQSMVNPGNIVINAVSNISDVQLINSDNNSISVGGHILPHNQLTASQGTSSGSQISLVENIDGKSLYGAQMISGQMLPGGQFITSEGSTFFIEAGDIINQPVVLNSAPGTFYFDLVTDGQYVNVPVATSLNQEPSVIVPGTTIIEASGNAYTTSNESVSLPSNSANIQSTVIDNQQLTTTVLSNAVASQEQIAGSSSQTIEGLHYTTLDNNEMVLFNPNVDLQSYNVDIKSKSKSEKVKSSGPIIVNPSKCSVCGKVFAQKVTLKSHMDEVHPGLHYCITCFDAFTSKEHLIAHKLQHQPASLSCTECDVMFTTKKGLSAHMQKIHKVGRYTGIKKEQRAFTCTQCDSRFCQLSDLKRHLLSHTGEKPFKCLQCGAGFTRKFSLKKHERIHTGEKPYTCVVCNQSFAYRHQFNRHMTTSHTANEPKIEITDSFSLIDS